MVKTDGGADNGEGGGISSRRSARIVDIMKMPSPSAVWRLAGWRRRLMCRLRQHMHHCLKIASTTYGVEVAPSHNPRLHGAICLRVDNGAKSVCSIVISGV
jgi:hypothetical protein